MSVKDIMQLLLPRSVAHSKQLGTLIEPLKSEGIFELSYAVFQDFPNKKRCRTTILNSSEKLLELVINGLKSYTDDAFVETQNFPLHTNAIFYPYDARYLTHHSPIIDLQRSLNICNEICICIRDTFLNRSELFWFYSQDENPDWFMQRLDNTSFLLKYILYFKENTAQIVSEPFIRDEEIVTLLPENANSIVKDNDDSKCKKSTPRVNKYYFGYPFVEPLSIKEFEVLKLYFLGNSTKEIAIKLFISARTVEKHLENILAKTACLHFKGLRHALFQCPLFYKLFL